MWGYIKPEGMRGLEVDHEFELGRLYDRKFGWLRAFEDLTDINTGLSVSCRNAGSVTHQATGGGKLA